MSKTILTYQPYIEMVHVTHTNHNELPLLVLQYDSNFCHLRKSIDEMMLLIERSFLLLKF